MKDRSPLRKQCIYSTVRLRATSGGAVADRRRQGYGFASRLSDEKVYRTAYSL